MMKIKDEAVEAALQRWRDEDHEDTVTLSREQVIDLCEEYRAALTTCQQEVERLRAASIASGNALYEARVRNAELVKALKPFTQTALVSDQYPDDYEVELTINVHGGPYEDQLTLEDFRRACAALKGQSNE